jgi:hypothetical protein
MRTPPRRAPHERTGALLALLIAGAACGPTNTVASHSPTPASASASTQASASPSSTASPSSVASATTSPTATPQPLSGAYGVLATRPAGGQYTVTIVGIDGKIVASKVVTAPPPVSCPGAGAVVPLPVSTSNTTLYYMDAAGHVNGLSPTLGPGAMPAWTVPTPTFSRRSMFAVSPDDHRIAVVVADFNASGASTRLYVEDLGGGNHVEIFSETGARTLWPIGWHGTGNLVLGVVPSCTQGGGPFCCGVQELHVVDPATANRLVTLGSSTCPIVGSPSPYGVICWDGSTSKVLNWTAATIRTYPVQGPEAQYVSPSGLVAMVDNTGTTFQGSNVSIGGLFACVFIDDVHVLAGGDTQQQARVGEFPSGVVFPVAAQGECAGRLPGGL